MTTMIEMYSRTYGELVEHHGETSVNGPCPICRSASFGTHKSNRFMIWADRTDRLGKTCTEHNIPGVCWCRQCRNGGDSIWYMMECEGLSFQEACEELGIKPRKEFPMKSRRAPAEKPHVREFEGRAMKDTRMAWQSMTARLDEEARATLPLRRSAMLWLLKKHGITPTMCERYGIGFLDGENGKDVRFRHRSAFGLPVTAGKDGKEHRIMAIRRGITIVSRDKDGEISMFRIRRPNPDVASDGRGKFWELEGGSGCSFHLPPSGKPVVKVYVITEGEMDAMLLHAVAGESIGCVAVRACTNRPDTSAHAALLAADSILVSLDSDEAGQKGTEWWLKTYRQARPFPIPGFKDPGDAFEAGFDLRLWLQAAMPRSLRLAEPTCGPLELPPVLSNMGERGKESLNGCPNNSDEEFNDVSGVDVGEFGNVLTHDVLVGIKHGLPPGIVIEAVPPEILAMSVLMRGSPVKYVKYPDGGFEWISADRWRHEHPYEHERLLRLMNSDQVSEWLSIHKDNEITSRNFLKIF